jgi:hypothetical protein
MPSEPPPDPDPSPADDTQSRRQRVGQYVALGAVCAYAAVQFYGADPRPWGLAAGWAAATAVILGPAAWVARDRLPPDRLETLTYVAFGAAILAIPVGLGAALAFEVPFFPVRSRLPRRCRARDARRVPRRAHRRPRAAARSRDLIALAESARPVEPDRRRHAV